MDLNSVTCPLTMPRKIRFLNTTKHRWLNLFFYFFFFFFCACPTTVVHFTRGRPVQFCNKEYRCHSSNIAFSTFSVGYEQNEEININTFFLKGCIRNFNYTLHIPGTIIILFSNRIWRKNKFPAKILRPLLRRFTTISVDERCPALIFLCRYFTKVPQETHRFVTAHWQDRWNATIWFFKPIFQYLK